MTKIKPAPAVEQQLLVTKLTKPQMYAVLDVEIDSLPDSVQHDVGKTTLSMSLVDVQQWLASCDTWITESDVDQRVRRLVEAAQERVRADAAHAVVVQLVDDDAKSEQLKPEPEQTNVDPHTWLAERVVSDDVIALGSWTRIAHAVENAAVAYAPTQLIALASSEHAVRLSGGIAEWKQLKSWAAKYLVGDATPADVPMIANLVSMKAKGQRDDYVQSTTKSARAKSATTKRSSASDADLRAYIDAFVDEHPTKGWTFALRTMRALGHSANHTVFAPLFAEIQSTKPQPEPASKPPTKRAAPTTLPAANRSKAAQKGAATRAERAAAKSDATKRADADSAASTGKAHDVAKRSESRRAAKSTAA